MRTRFYSILFLFVFLVLTHLSASSQGFDETGLVFWLTADSIDSDVGMPISVLTENAQDIISDNILGDGIVLQSAPELLDKRVLDFGASQTLYDFSISVPLPLTTFVVHKSEVTIQSFFMDTPSRMLGLFNSNSSAQYGNVPFTVQNPGEYVVSTFSSDASTGSVYVNGDFKNSGANTRSINGTLRLGASWSADRYYPGQIAEMLVFDEELSPARRVEIETYLMHKYAPPISFDLPYFILPGCTRSISVPEIYKSYQWEKVNEDGSLEFMGSEYNVLIADTGNYRLTATSVFDEITVDTLQVRTYTPVGLEDATACQAFPHQVELGVDQDSIAITWSDSGLTGASVSISTPGTYYATLTQPNGCEFISEEFEISDIEEVAEIMGAEVFCTGNDLSVINDPELSILWNTNEVTSIITPSSDGQYWVSLTSPSGCVGRDTVDIVSVGVSPLVEFEIGPACEDNVVMFSDNTVPQTGSILSWEWDLSVGSGTGADTVAIYPNHGSFPIQLTVSLDNGCIGVGRDTVHVSALPLVLFDLPIVCEGSSADFADMSLVPDGGMVFSSDWDFGNGNLGSGTTVSTDYLESGEFQVELIVQTSDGCVDSLTQVLHVLPSWSADCQEFALAPDFWMLLDLNDDSLAYLTDYVSGMNSEVSAPENRASMVTDPRVNDQPVALFDGVDDYYDFQLSMDLPFSIFTVLRPQKDIQNFFIDTENRMIGGFTPPDAGLYGSAGNYSVETPSDWMISSFVSDTTDQFIQVYVNGDSVGTGVNDRPIVNWLRLGAAWTNDRYYEGEIAEMIIFNSVLDEDEQQEIEAYLLDKYSPAPDLGGDRVILPGCSETLQASPHFNSFSWFNLENGVETFISEGANSIDVESDGTYIIETISLFGQVARDTVTLLPFDESVLQSLTICESQGVQMSLGELDPVLTVEWSDPSLTGANVVIEAAGEYTVTITDELGCGFDSDPFLIEFLDDYVEILSDEVFCLGSELYLPEGFENIELIDWSNGDDTFSIVPLIDGEYWVEVTNSLGCMAQDTVDVIIQGELPIAGFGFSNICFLDEVQFVDNSVAPNGAIIDSYTWDFGDGNGADVASPQHEFSVIDTFLVSLTVVTDQGCVDDFSTELIIAPIPTAGFQNDFLCHGLDIEFTDASVVSTGFISSSQWSFDSDPIQTGISAVNQYDDPGDYELTHIVVTDRGCVDTLSQSLVVNGSPESSFLADTVCIGSPTVFQATPDESVSGPVNQFLWDFGAGSSIFEVTTFTFQNPGLNPVTLTVTSALGCADDTTMNIVIGEDPIAGFSWGMACVGEPVSFIDTSVVSAGDEVALWNWFYSGGESESESPQIVFEALGAFSVTLDVETVAGCSDQVEALVDVSGFPTSEFTVEPTIGSPPLSPSFENLSEGASSYEWTFDFGQLSFDSLPSHTFTDSGLVFIDLTVFNEAGCSATSSQPLFLTEPITDLVLIQVEHTLQAGFLKPVLSVRNLGNYDLEEFIIELELPDGALFQEHWQGLLERNSSMIYPMATSLYYDEMKDLPFYCVRLIPIGNRSDVDESNNVLCKTIGDVSNEVFFIDPSPNPVQDLLSFGLVNAGSGRLEIDLYDMKGTQILHRVEDSTGELVQEFSLSMTNLNAGRYLLKLRIGLEERVFKIQVLR